jgi:hypothetical protein
VLIGNSSSHADRITIHQNHKEHERRWVKGSFLEVVRAHVKSKYGSSFPAGWRVWLSMNPENDGTAIWLERKFDAPASGQWESETVFSIPLRQKDNTTASSPGMIAFECTPLERVSDDLERYFNFPPLYPFHPLAHHLCSQEIPHSRRLHSPA